MKWNWQHKDWPEFKYDSAALSELENRFLQQSGMLQGTLRHVGEDDKSRLTVDLMSTEAISTSEIEGEILNRDSVQSSIRRNFGLDSDDRRILPAEQGIAEMMVDLYRTFGEPLTHPKLFTWHEMLTRGRRDLTDVGLYRAHEEAMQVVSGAIHDPTIHFEAPPSKEMRKEMDRYIDWFNGSGPDAEHPLPALTRAGIAHLYFVCIHPFEDGNGRIGRAISEMAFSQGLGQPTLLALSYTINNAKKAYYRNLELSNKDLEITDWLLYFASTVLDAQTYSQRLIDFLIAKIRLYDRLRGQLNERQDKVIVRMFREGLEGFEGGLSAENYISITGTSRATATRDLQDLVEKGALMRTGERRHTRYWLNIDVLEHSG
jgi:Fic family protein